MPFPTIVYNASTGSDTAASGAPSGMTAVTGTNGDGAGTTTFTLNETVDFTGVADDDSDVLWVNFTAGTRHLYQITAFNPSVGAATTLTVAETLPSQTGKSWAVGGKRKTTENDTSQTDFEDAKGGWILEFEAGTYSINVVNNLAATTIATDGPMTFRAASGASPVLDYDTDAGDGMFVMANGTELRLEGLRLLNDIASFDELIRMNSSSNLEAIDCEFETAIGSATAFYLGSDHKLRLVNCRFIDSGAADNNQVHQNSGTVAAVFIGCTFINAAQHAVRINAATFQDNHWAFIDCVFHNPGGSCISFEGSKKDLVSCDGCVFDGAAADGIAIDAYDESAAVAVYNCVFSNNGAYGIDSPAGGDSFIRADYNAYYNNTSGARNNLSAGTNDVTLTADPYTAVGSDDFSLNNDAGGGAACRGAGFPGTLKDGVNVGYRDIGALQVQAGAGGAAELLQGHKLVLSGRAT